MNWPGPDQKKLIAEQLLKGKESATQLQTLLQKPSEDPGSVSPAELTVQILRSFTDSLCALGFNEIRQIVAGGVTSTDCYSDRSSKTTAGQKRKPGVKERRGCYRRRNVSDISIKFSFTVEDEYAWRKYGQKQILHSDFPRCYFRCTHKYDQECKATKQVQCVKKNPPVYQITYFGRHTCDDKLRAARIIQESDPMDSYLLSFETKMPSKQESLSSAVIPSSKEVLMKEDTHSDVSDNKSVLDSTLWEDLMTSGSSSSGPAELMPIKTGLSHVEEVVSGISSFSSDSLHGLDMEGFSKFDDFEESDFNQFPINKVGHFHSL